MATPNPPSLSRLQLVVRCLYRSNSLQYLPQGSYIVRVFAQMNADLTIHADGAAFTDGVYDLRYLETLLASYRQILDRLIALQTGNGNVTDKLKRDLGYNVRVREGSLQVLVDLVFQYPELLGSLAHDDGLQVSRAITRLFRSAINLRRYASEFLTKGLPISITISNSFNVGSNNVKVVNNSGQIEISDSNILWAAQKTRAPTDRIIRRIDGSNLDSVRLATGSDETRLDTHDHDLLRRHRESLNSDVRIVGRLDMISFSQHRGRIVSGPETFNVTWDDHLRRKLQSVADIDNIVFYVTPTIDQSRLDRVPIAFHIIDCDSPYQDTM